MKWLFQFIISIIISIPFAYSQPNLIPNGSFEDYKNCPIEPTMLDSNINAYFWFGYGGFSPVPAYYNGCSNPLSNFEFGVPFNNKVYQPAKSGNAYVGFYPSTYDYINDLGLHNNYIGVRLKEKCINRLNYYGSFYCAAIDFDPNMKFHFENGDSSYRVYSISSLSMFLSPTKEELNTENSLLLPAQINNNPLRVLSDTVNWMEVSGSFKSNGTEQYLTIGSFTDSANTVYFNTYGYPEPWLKKKYALSIYYIDDVSLIPQNTTHYYDTLLCSNAPLQLGAVAQADSFEWHDGNKTDKIRSFTTAGLVWVKSWLYGGTVYMWDSLNIIPNNINSSLPKDTFLCNEQTQLSISTTNANAGATYLWNNGSTGKSLVLNNINWVNGKSKIWLTTTANYCTHTDTVTIYQKPALQIPINDTTSCFEDVPQILLDAGANYKSYLWLPTGETSKTVYSNQAQIYKLTVTDSFNCSASKNIIVDELCKAEIFLPNAFTPNGDGKNETYKPILKTKNLLQYQLKIYDNWGAEVFTTADPNQAWDAKNNLQGVYVVTVNYQYKNFVPNVAKGTVTVLR